MNLRPLSFASAALAGLLLAAAPAPAATPQERLKACAAEWTAAQAAKTVPAGQTRKDFLAECAARTGSAPAAPAAGSAASAPAATGTQPASPAAGPRPAPAAPAATAASPQSRMKQCSAEWQAAKAAGKVPAGQSWQKFYSECNERLQASAPAAQPVTATPAAKPAATPAAKPAATTSAKPEDEDTGEGVKHPTQAQLAARARIKECGTEWRALKEAGKTPANETWPHFWSTCNTRLKAAGK